MSDLTESSQKVVDKLLSGDVDQLHRALADLPGLPDKKAVAHFLADRLSKEENGDVRSRIISGLAAVGEPGAAALIADRVDPKIEDDGWARYWAAIGLARLAPDDLDKQLLKAKKDPLANIRDSVTNLVKVNVVFLGYVRQINQIDATFKQMFLAAAGFGIDQMKLTVAQIQDSVRTTMQEVEGYLGGQRPA